MPSALNFPIKEVTKRCASSGDDPPITCTSFRVTVLQELRSAPNAGVPAWRCWLASMRAA